jgi:hypothetical protein
MQVTATSRRIAALVLTVLAVFALAWATTDSAPATIGDCTGIDLSTTFDANHDGVIDCGRDIELGA